MVEISTLWHSRLPLLIQMFIKVASSPRLSGIGMPSPILWSHLLKMQRIVLLSSLLWWELGTNSLITGPGEWLSLRRFTSKLSWSWSWRYLALLLVNMPKDSKQSPRISWTSDNRKDNVEDSLRTIGTILVEGQFGTALESYDEMMSRQKKYQTSLKTFN